MVDLNVKEIEYQIVESKCKEIGLENETVYGIESKVLGGCNSYLVIEDICNNKEKVEQLILLLKMEKAHPDQLLYIVEDFLGELY